MGTPRNLELKTWKQVDRILKGDELHAMNVWPFDFPEWIRCIETRMEHKERRPRR